MGLSNRTLVEAGWLSRHLNDDNVIVADCRYNLMDSSEGRRKYLEDHIPGAYFVDMEADLTGEKREHGGRHPIPERDDFSSRMSSIGVEDGKVVVAYDDDLSGASRLWWLLNYFGHSEVYVLNGGIAGWISEGGKLTKDLPKERNAAFVPRINSDLLFDVHSVKNNNSHMVVDSRARERYLGIHEPIDFKAGHIPGSINVFYKDVLKDDGMVKSKEELRELFKDAGSSPVVYCGSGITSCVNILGLALIGIDARLYAGSWSDWISYPDNEVKTGDSP